MSAERITVGVYPLDQVLLPKTAAGRGWMIRLTEEVPGLVPEAEPQPVILETRAEGLVLAEKTRLAGTDHDCGLKVAIEQVAGRAALFLIRIAGKPVAVACADSWDASISPAERPDWPEGLAAYAAGTLIDTPDGPRPVETLATGDAVTTLANGSRPLRWIGRRRVPLLEILAKPGLRPVEFAAGTVGNARPLLVSPGQRMLIDDWRAEVYFGEDRVLVAAQALVDDHTTRLVLPDRGIDYVTLLCDRHEVLLAEGALSESFHPGEAGLAALTASERAEVASVVPEEDLTRRRAAFPIVRNAEARALRF